MNWKHGYYADSGYTYGYYAETSPLRLAWAALTQGHHAPVQGFRYLDAGCGQGLNLILMAAAHPESEFVGIDFLPEHIAHAQALSKAAGLSNVSFIEGDFVELAGSPKDLGQFDYAVCHGITTWIAPAVKQALFSLIGQALKPGGLFYNSYNTFPGWLSAVPFQHLVLLEQRSKTGAIALQAARSSMDRMAELSPAMFTNLPGLPVRLKGMDSQDPAYLVQEYNNHYWQPVFVSQMMDDMAAVKLSYLGSATLAEAYDLSLVPAVRDLLAQQSVPSIREQLRDYAINQTFRRDLYVKGQSKPWMGNLNSLIRSMSFMANPLAARPEAGQPFIIKSGTTELSGGGHIYGTILDLIAGKDSCTVGEIIDQLSDAPTQNMVPFIVSMLLYGGWIFQKQNINTEKSDINVAIAAAVSAGAPYRYLSLPAIGGAMTFGEVDILLVHAIQQGVSTADLGRSLDAALQKLGRSFMQDGQVVTDRPAHQKKISNAVSEFMRVKYDLLRRCGAIQA